MRILRVAPWLYPDSKGGGQYHVHAMSRDQAMMGHNVTVVTTKEYDGLPNREETDGYEIVRLPKGLTVAGNDISPWLARYLQRYADEYDIVHAHSHLYFSTNLAAACRRLGDVPLAITNHGLYSQSAPEWIFDAYLRTLGKWTFKQADVVFCYTDTDKERLRNLGVLSRIEVISNGIDTERFTPKGPDSELIDADGPVILFVGRLVEGKRPEIAVEAFADVLAEYPDAELYICGDGPLREDLVTQVRELDILSSVSFLGHVPYSEMPKIYRSSNLLVLPSRAEGVPRTVLEAISSGTQVITSDLDQIEQIINEQDGAVSAANTDEFIKNIKSMLRSDYISNELNEEYSWTNTVKETTQFLHLLCDGSI